MSFYYHYSICVTCAIRDTGGSKDVEISVTTIYEIDGGSLKWPLVFVI